MQTVQNKYQELKNICNYRAQAFLCSQVWRLTAGDQSCFSGGENTTLALIKHHMGWPWLKKLYMSSPKKDHDWENLEKTWDCLLMGVMRLPVSSLKREEADKEFAKVSSWKERAQEPHDNEKKKEEVIYWSLPRLTPAPRPRTLLPKKKWAELISIWSTRLLCTTPSPAPERELPSISYRSYWCWIMGWDTWSSNIKNTQEIKSSHTSNQEKEALIHMKVYLKKVLALLILSSSH